MNMIYLIKNKSTHWGDWSDLLWSGFAPYDDETNLVYIERSGPFVPPIYIAGGNLIFTETAKESYSSYFDSLHFPYILEKRKIVNIDWQDWDKDKEYYDYLEDVLEPEDLIEDLSHDPKLVSQLPELWLAEPKNEIHILIDNESKSSNYSDYLNLHSAPPSDWDFMSGIEYGGYFINNQVKKWLEDNFPDCFEMYLIAEKKKE